MKPITTVGVVGAGTMGSAIAQHFVMKGLSVILVDQKQPPGGLGLKPGQRLTEEEVVQYCRDNLAGFKVPKNIVFAELPKTSTGNSRTMRRRSSRPSSDLRSRAIASLPTLGAR